MKLILKTLKNFQMHYYIYMLYQKHMPLMSEFGQLWTLLHFVFVTCCALNNEGNYLKSSFTIQTDTFL